MRTPPILNACNFKSIDFKADIFHTIYPDNQFAMIAQSCFVIVFLWQPVIFQGHVFQIANQFSVLNQKLIRTKFYFVFITLALSIDFESFKP